MSKSEEINSPVITLENAHLMSPYELRQELTRRGKFDFENEDHVNFKSMLKKLVKALLEEQQTNEDEVVRENDSLQDDLKEKLLKEKEERKRLAIERSEKRQADKAYFENKRLLNESSKVVEEVEDIDNNEEDNEKEEEIDENEEEVFDPFRMSGTHTNFKVHVN